MEKAATPHHPRDGNVRLGSVSSATSPPEQLKRVRAARAARRAPSVQPGGNAAHDDWAGATERRTIRSGDVAVPGQRQDAELLVLETAKALVDGVLGPLIDVSVPDRAVIGGGRGNAAKRIVRSMPVRQRGENTLTLRIGAGALRWAVHRDEDPLDRAAGDVVDPDLESVHTWGERVPLDGRHGGVARVGRDVKNRLAEAEAIDQVERNGPVHRVDGDHLVMDERVVRIAVREIDGRIFQRRGDDRRVVNDAVGADQRAVVRIPDRARLGLLGRERSIFGAGYHHAGRAEVYEARLE